MSRRTFPAREIAYLLALSVAGATARAASASGTLVHANGSPAPGVTVTLSNERGRSAPAQSDGKGAYSLSNIPAGQYYLEVWVNPRTPKTMQVTIREPATNLPPVTVK